MKVEKANLFIVGAAKSGTTSLYYYLSQHPDVFMSSVKEPHFFCSNIAGNMVDYLNPKKGVKYHSKIIKDEKVYEDLFEEGIGKLYRGEASPSYLWDMTSAKKIFEYNPKSKIIILLRHPIERTFSHYRMDFASGVELNENFKEALIIDNNNNNNKWGQKRLYIDLSQYRKQVTNYLNVFGNDNVLVIPFSSLRLNLSYVLMRVSCFLGISEEGFNSVVLNPQNESTEYIFPFIKNLFLYIFKYKYLRVFLEKFRSYFPFVRRLIMKKASNQEKYSKEDELFLLNHLKDSVDFYNTIKNEFQKNR